MSESASRPSAKPPRLGEEDEENRSCGLAQNLSDDSTAQPACHHLTRPISLEFSGECMTQVKYQSKTWARREIEKLTFEVRETSKKLEAKHSESGEVKRSLAMMTSAYQEEAQKVRKINRELSEARQEKQNRDQRYARISAEVETKSQEKDKLEHELTIKSLTLHEQGMENEDLRGQLKQARQELEGGVRTRVAKRIFALIFGLISIVVTFLSNPWGLTMMVCLMIWAFVHVSSISSAS